jgi:hypothetical protein
MDVLAECNTDLKLRFGQDEESLSDFVNVRKLWRNRTLCPNLI